MPPVFGPVSCSPTRLKSCAGEQLFDQEVAAGLGRCAQAGVELVLRLADEDALSCCEAVDLDHAGRARDREALRGGHAGRLEHVLGERLRAFDARRLRTGAEHGDPVSPQLVADARDKRAFGPDHDEVGIEREGQCEQPVCVVGAHGVALAECGDARVAGGGMELRQVRAASEAPREGMLTRA